MNENEVEEPLEVGTDHGRSSNPQGRLGVEMKPLEGIQQITDINWMVIKGCL